MDELKLEELKHELEGTNIQVSLVDGGLEVIRNNVKFTMWDEQFLNMPVSNIVVDLIESIELENK